MPYTTAYQIRYQTDEKTIINITIYDTTTYTSNNLIPTEFIDLGEAHQGNYPSSPFIVRTIDTARNPFNAIKAKQADIQFFSSNQFDITIFSIGEDNRFFVEAIVEGSNYILFRGFLVMDDHNRPFQPHPNIVTLSLTDNLALLKTKALVDWNNHNPRGKFKIIQYIAWALSRTGLKLDIVVSNSFYEESFPNLCAWDNIYLDVKTFEKQIGFSEDCYTVLTKILGYDCTLSQINGAWYISHIDELDLNIPTNPFWFDWQGISKGNYGQSELRQFIYQQIKEDQIIHYSRPAGYVKLSYNYDLPAEIIDNIDFRRGNWISPIIVDINPFVAGYSKFTDMPKPGTTGTIYKVFNPAPGTYYRWNGLQYIPLSNIEIPRVLAYQCDDWVMMNNGRPVSASAYIVRVYLLGVETQRFLRMLPSNTSASPWDYLRCNPISIGYLDKATVSIDFRWESKDRNNGPDGRYIFTFYILGSDANYYCFDQPNNQWKNVGQSIQGTNFGWAYKWNSQQVNVQEQQTASVDLPVFPIDGQLYIGIYNGYTFDTGAANQVIVDYSNLQFVYSPYINGGYQKFVGQYRLVSQIPDYVPLIQYYPGDIINITTMQTGNYSGSIDDTVYISDSPKPLFRGAMFKLNNVGQFVLAGNFYAGNALAQQDINPPIDPSFLHPFGHLQIYAVWNKNRREFIWIEGTWLGLNTKAGNVPDLNNIYILSLPSQFTNNKSFFIATIEQDFETCTYKATLLEVGDVTIPNQYENLNPELFAYISKSN